MKSEMTRRDFLKLSGAVGATAIAAGVLSGCSTGSSTAASSSTATAATETSAAAKEIKTILGSVAQSNFVLYDPGTGDADRSRICILKMYGSSRSADVLPDTNTVYPYAEMGYRACNCSPRTGYFIDQVQALSDVIDWLKENVEGLEKIVLWGNSRGCNLNSAYQRIAENGAATFQTDKMFKKIPDMTLTPADAIMHFDANHGFMVNVLASLASNLLDDDSVMQRDPTMDPSSEANGCNPETGEALYSDEFLQKTWKAQAERYNRLLQRAVDRQAKIDAGEGMFSDDEPFCVVMGFGNVNNYQLYEHDRRFYNSTKNAWPILHPDGTITEEVVKSLHGPQKPAANFESMSRCYNTTVSEFLYLGMHVDADEFHYDATTLYGVDDDNFSSADGNSRYISVPTLCVGRTDGSEFEVAEWIYEKSIVAKKDIVFIEGMTHGGSTNDPEKYGDVNAREEGYVDQWLLNNVL